jgi:probable rRNA maturation factor
MNLNPLTNPVTVDLQNATGDSGLPGQEEWSRWVNVAIEMAAGDERPADAGAQAVSVRLVGQDESRQLNSTYRNQSGATNVLAFPGPDRDAFVPEVDRALGDIVICLPVVYGEAKVQGKAPAAHMAHMVVHGTLHLLGYDHDSDPVARRMEALETKILMRLGFPDPYAVG